MHVLALLTIVVWPNGLGGASHHWTLRCGPPGGTLPQATAACDRLAAIDRPFAPVPPMSACTAIYGGPRVARVTGTYRGRKVWATFRRRNGCEIARWNKVAFLFP
jgi:hypothetical protein